jgi:hypothetical protein
VTTDEEGRAQLSSLQPGRWYLQLSAGGASYTVTVDLVPGRVSEVRLRSGSGVVVTGIVSEHGRGPLAKVTIALTTTRGPVRSSYWGTTDEKGRYRIPNVPPGVYTLTAVPGPAGSFRRREVQFVVEAPGPVTRDVVVGVPGLSGVVCDGTTGRPIPGVSIRVQNGAFASATTDPQGRFLFLDLAQGPHRLLVSKPGYGLLFLDGVTGRETVEIELEPAARLRLRVIRPSGEPYVGRLYLGVAPVVRGEGTQVGTSLTTDDAGRGAYDQVVPGQYTLDLRADGVGAAKVSVTIPSGEIEVDVRLE